MSENGHQAQQRFQSFANLPTLDKTNSAAANGFRKKLPLSLPFLSVIMSFITDRKYGFRG
jgi:hypothetical protein